MRAMILAAGRGERMGPLTANTPKPLLQAGGKTLIEYAFDAVREAGVSDVVVNHAYLGEQIVAFVGDGTRFGLNVQFSAEPEGALETGGGILQALPLLGPEPFLVVNADVYCEMPLARLPASPPGLAHLVLVPNPDHNPDGDFALSPTNVVSDGEPGDNTPRYTMGGLGVYRPELWAGCQPGRFRTPPLMHQYMPDGAITGEVFNGPWFDIGTPERLAALDTWLEG